MLGRLGKLSIDDERKLETWRREHVCFDSVGVDQLSRLLMAAFLPIGRPWSRRALEDYLAVPRTTLLRKLKALEASGIVSHREDGWQVTYRGAKLGRELLAETGEIVNGTRDGYSEGVIRSMKAAGFDVSEKAGAVSFGPFPRHKRTRKS